MEVYQFSSSLAIILMILITFQLQIRRGERDNLGINFPYYPIKTYVVIHHETVLMRGHNICFR